MGLRIQNIRSNSNVIVDPICANGYSIIAVEMEVCSISRSDTRYVSIRAWDYGILGLYVSSDSIFDKMLQVERSDEIVKGFTSYENDIRNKDMHLIIHIEDNTILESYDSFAAARMSNYSSCFKLLRYLVKMMDNYDSIGIAYGPDIDIDFTRYEPEIIGIIKNYDDYDLTYRQKFINKMENNDVVQIAEIHRGSDSNLKIKIMKENGDLIEQYDNFVDTEESSYYSLICDMDAKLYKKYNELYNEALNKYRSKFKDKTNQEILCWELSRRIRQEYDK